jgi:hypothetical protein
MLQGNPLSCGSPRLVRWDAVVPHFDVRLLSCGMFFGMVGVSRGKLLLASV